MSSLRLTMSCGLYELTRPLVDGEVRPEGIDLAVDTSDPNRIYSLRRRNECDIAEFNVTEYFRARDNGHPLTALPVFPHRRFRHGYVFVNTSKGISKPPDLIGRTVGVWGRSGPAAAVWVRGILQEFHGVPFAEVDWRENPLEPMDGSSEPAAGLTVSDEMLLAGELDALVSPGIPAAIFTGDERIARLFPDHKERSIAYYRQTGIFPIMYAVTLRQELVDRHPWVVQSLLAAFDEAKRIAYERVSNPRLTPLAFFEAAWEEQQALLGPDPWEYGLTEANRRNLETAIRYTSEQGRLSRELSVDELFAS